MHVQDLQKRYNQKVRKECRLLFLLLLPLKNDPFLNSGHPTARTNAEFQQKVLDGLLSGSYICLISDNLSVGFDKFQTLSHALSSKNGLTSSEFFPANSEISAPAAKAAGF